MSSASSAVDPVAFLVGIADELTEVHRGRDFSQWRSEASHRVGQYLERVKPFSEFATAWVFTGDGAGTVVGGRLGGWAIDRLVENISPEAIVALFEEEVRCNSAVYEDVSPVLGIEIMEECVIGEGIRLVPGPMIYSAVSTTFGRSRGPTCRMVPATSSNPTGSRRHSRSGQRTLQIPAARV